MTPWLCAFDAFTSLLYAPHTLTRTLPQITNLNSLQLSLYITSKVRQYIIKSALSEMAMQGFDYRSFKSLCVSKERPFESGQNQWYFPSRVSLRFSAVRWKCTLREGRDGSGIQGIPSPPGTDATVLFASFLVTCYGLSLRHCLSMITPSIDLVILVVPLRTTAF